MNRDAQLIDTAMDDLAEVLKKYGIVGEPAVRVASAFYIAAGQIPCQLGAALYRQGYIARDDEPVIP